MVSLDYLIYGSKRLFRKPILEIIHFGYHNCKLIPIHALNKTVLKKKGDLSISDHEFATSILSINLANSYDIYDSVYSHMQLKEGCHFFFDPKNARLKEDYVSNYSKQAKETVEYANKYLNHEFSFLGRQIKFNDKVNYQYGFEQNYTQKYFSDVNCFTPDWDTKVTWELNRQQHLTILGKAYFITNCEKYAKEICDQIEQWIEQNPYLLGVNWIEGIEAAIRMYSWIFAYYFILNSKSLTQEVNFKILKYIYLHGRFIRTFLSDKWIINGNHLLAELSGLLLIGISFPEFKESKEWVSFALQKLESELNTQVFDDGAIWEHSTGYQKFVTEMVLYPVILFNNRGVKFPQTILLKLEKMLDFLDSISMFNGKIPLVGDEDQGFMLKIAFSEYDDIRDILSCGEVLLQKEYSSFDSELPFWLFNGLTLKLKEKNSKNEEIKIYKNSGYCLFKSQNDYLLLTTNAENRKYIHAAHRHLDMLSFVYEYRSEYFIVDNGTYIYNSDKDNRNLFRSTYMHNTLTVDNLNPCTLGPFELHPKPYGKIVKSGKINDSFFLWASHDGYGLKYKRIIIRTDIGFLIHDFAMDRISHIYKSYMHLHPDVNTCIIDDCKIILSKNDVMIQITSLEPMKIVDSKYSPAYGYFIDSKALEIETNLHNYENTIKISKECVGINEIDMELISKIMTT